MQKIKINMDKQEYSVKYGVQFSERVKEQPQKQFDMSFFKRWSQIFSSKKSMECLGDHAELVKRFNDEYKSELIKLKHCNNYKKGKNNCIKICCLINCFECDYYIS
jgi:hypothetical protein